MEASVSSIQHSSLHGTGVMTTQNPPVRSNNPASSSSPAPPKKEDFVAKHVANAKDVYIDRYVDVLISSIDTMDEMILNEARMAKEDNTVPAIYQKHHSGVIEKYIKPAAEKIWLDSRKNDAIAEAEKEYEKQYGKLPAPAGGAMQRILRTPKNLSRECVNDLFKNFVKSQYQLLDTQKSHSKKCGELAEILNEEQKKDKSIVRTTLIAWDTEPNRNFTESTVFSWFLSRDLT
jgi:hypothetical protein